MSEPGGFEAILVGLDTYRRLERLERAAELVSETAGDTYLSPAMWAAIEALRVELVEPEQ